MNEMNHKLEGNALSLPGLRQRLVLGIRAAMTEHCPPVLRCAFLLFVGAGSAFAADRPNILFLFADDWGRHASAYAEIDEGDLGRRRCRPDQSVFGFQSQ